MHEPDAARVVPQVFVEMEKSEALLPVIAMLLIVRVVVPLFLTVTVWVAEVAKSSVTGNVIEVGDNVTAGPAPVPVSDTD